ncbi:MAG: hypothetical protein ACLTLQ_10940 [[Clostridium] scindens]
MGHRLAERQMRTSTVKQYFKVFVCWSVESENTIETNRSMGGNPAFDAADNRSKKRRRWQENY